MVTPTPEPYQIAVPDDLLTWINDRVRTVRIPPGKDLPADKSWTFGLPVETATKLHNYWTQKYDWRAIERDLNNDLKQFTVPITYKTEVLNIHFVHHRSHHKNAIPLLFLHGWPGSFLEVRPIIHLLTNPSDPSQQAYHVVAPSLAGFGFSSYPKQVFGPIDHAAVMHSLMTQLNYTCYMLQGGDWGSIIARVIATNEPTSCPAIHVNMVCAAPPSALWQPFKLGKLVLGFMTGLMQTAYEKKMLGRLMWWQKDEFGYSSIQGTKPQTIQYALADSPFGFVCWIRDKLEHLVDYEAGWVWNEEEVITMVMPYIVNGSPGHAEIYKWSHDGSKERDDLTAAVFDTIIPRTSSFGASIFPKDAVYAQKWWAEAKIAENIVFWKEHEKGGHFASLETPEVLVEDIRTFTVRIDDGTLAKLRSKQ